VKKVFLPSMTWKEVQETFRERPVVMFPLGSVEQHGPHAPTGDYRMAETLAIQAAEKAGDAVVLPALPFGYSEYFKGFPGCLSLRPFSLYNAVKDVCECVLDFGIDHLLFINGHKGNEPILEYVARELRRERGIILASVAPWSCLTPEFYKSLYGDRVKDVGHGSEPMGSLGMHFYPDQMRLDLMESSKRARDYGDFEIAGPSLLKLNGTPVMFYQHYHEAFSNGVMGDPKLASAERGQKMHEWIVERLVEVVKAFHKLDTKARAGPGGVL
jgi:creatinine amidohydrolase